MRYNAKRKELDNTTRNEYNLNMKRAIGRRKQISEGPGYVSDVARLAKMSKLQIYRLMQKGVFGDVKKNLFGWYVFEDVQEAAKKARGAHFSA